MGAIYFNLSLFSGKYVKTEIKTEMYFSQVSVGSAFFDTFFSGRVSNYVHVVDVQLWSIPSRMQEMQV